MQKKILQNLIIVSLCGIVLATVALYVIQSIMASRSADDLFGERLHVVAERIKENDYRIEVLVNDIKEDYLVRARAVAQMLELDPIIIADRNKLVEIAASLDLEELHISDRYGVIRWTTVPECYGVDIADCEKTKPFMAILDDPTLEIAQDPMINDYLGVERQYVAVSLRGRKGVVQVGMTPMRVEVALIDNSIVNVLNGISVGKSGYVFSVSPDTGLITSHPNVELVKTAPPEPLKEYGYMNIDGQRVRYRSQPTSACTIVAVLPVSELYGERPMYTFIFFSFMLFIFSAVCAAVSIYIKRRVIDGISATVHTLEIISSGDLSVTADIHSSEEFVKLSCGINDMLDSIRSRELLAEKAQRFGAVIASAGAGVIIKNRRGEIVDWNLGAENIIGFTASEMLGCTHDVYMSESGTECIDDINRRLLEGERFAHEEIRVVHKNGKTIICSTSFSPIFGERGGVNGSVVVFHDVTAERLAEEKARRLAAMVGIADAGIVVMDAKGYILEWNIGAQNILGYTADEMVGTTGRACDVDGYLPYIEEIHRKLTKGEHTVSAEVAHWHKDGYLVHSSASYTPIFDNNGSFTGSMMVFHDMSDKKRMEGELTEALVAAEDASRAKSSFLANMSHEMRTPLNGVVGFAELALGEEGVTDSVRDFLGKIKACADGLLEIINDILDLSKIEAGAITVENIPFDLHDLIRTCEAMSSPKAEEKGISLYFHDEPVIGKKLMGDPTKLRQALLNLLSNAIKFTNYGMVKLATVMKDLGDGRVSILFEVTDSGIGMTSDQITGVFGLFTQADSSTTRKYGGTGLGLPITKNLIELMGGELRVESESGVGSRFSFELTFVTTVEQISESADADAPFLSEKPMFEAKVLVCEDNAINQQVIKHHLQRVGIVPTIVSNGKLGVDEAETRLNEGKPFDLIFMDIHMPVMDGLEATQMLIAMGSKTPVIALTANAMSTDKAKYLEYGMSYYISKPFTTQALWSCLMKYLQPVSMIPMAQSESHPSATKSCGVIDRAKGIENCAGDEQLYERMVKNFLKDDHDAYDRITHALHAGAIIEAHRMAHTLKGIASLIGAGKLEAAARKVERALADGKPDCTGDKLAALQSALAEVLGEIGIDLSEPDIAENIGELDKEKALALIENLLPLLEHGNPDSLSFMDEIRATLSPAGELCTIFLSQLDDYDFDAALDTARSLISLLGNRSFI